MALRFGMLRSGLGRASAARHALSFAVLGLACSPMSGGWGTHIAYAGSYERGEHTTSVRPIKRPRVSAQALGLRQLPSSATPRPWRHVRAGYRELRPRCGWSAASYGGCLRRYGRENAMVDALLGPPHPASRHLIEELGVPVIQSVPPIVILQPGHGATTIQRQYQVPWDDLIR